MRTIVKLVLLLSCIITAFVIPQKVHAQTDTRFWVALPYLSQNHGWNMDGRHLVVSTLGSPATVTVSVPANPSFKPIVVDIPANSTERIDMTSYAAEVLMKEFDEVTKKGILIESTDKVTAYMEVMNPQNAEIYALKGQYAQGIDFYVPAQNKLDNYIGFADTAFSSVDIVATEDNTVITITPSKPIMKKGAKSVYPAGTPYTITLQKGQTYSARAVNGAAASHLSGTHITATKPIVVSYKDDSVVRGGWDLVGDQLIPVSVMGTQYIAVKGFLQMSAPEDEFVFLAIAESGTTLTVDNVAFGGPYAAGTTVAVPVKNKYTVIESNGKKFTAFHLTGTKAELAGTVLPPTDQCTGTTRAGFSYSYGTNTATSTDKQELYINIMVRKGAEAGFLLDGAPTTLIKASGFTAVNTFWSVGQFGPFDYSTIAKGAHVLSNTIDQFHMGYLNTSGPSTVYGYFSDFKPSIITAVAVKTKSDVAVQCEGDSTRLRVDGGIKYDWKMYDDTDPTTDVAPDYLSDLSSYNPYVIETTPIGKYTIKVKVWGPCGALPVDKIIKMEVKAKPHVVSITESICESEYGSGCTENYDLDKFLPKIYDGTTGLSVVRWRKKVLNSMFPLDDFENDRNLTYNTNNAGTFNTSYPNPQISSTNSSATVMMFKVSGSAGYFTFSPRGGIKLDMNQGTKFSLLIRNVSTFTSTLRTVTMKLIGTAGDTVKITNTMSKFNAWEEMQFDFSAAPKKIYSEAMIEFGKLDWQTDVFYIDDIRKLIDSQIVRIDNTDSAAFCSGGELYLTVQNADQCQVEATVKTTIGPGSFTVKNPSIALCESEYGTGKYTGYDLSALLPQIVSGTGYSIDTVTGWKYIAKNQQDYIEDFDKNTTTVTAVSGTFVRNYPNPTKILNSSTLSGRYSDLSSTASALSISLPKKISLADGSKFYIQMYDSATTATGAVTVVMELRGSGVTTLSRTGTIAGDYKWENLEFDFSTDNTKSGFDEIRLLVSIPGYRTDYVYIDNLYRLRTDHEDYLPFSVKNATITDGDKFFAYVKDANGCLVKSTITFSVKPGTGTANAITPTICQSVPGGVASGVDLTQYSNQIIGAAGVSAGNTLIKWVKKYVDYQDTLSNFEKVGSISWKSTAAINTSYANPFPVAPNTSSKVLYVPNSGSTFVLNGALSTPIDLSKGYIFKIKAGYRMTATYGNGSTDAHTMLVELVSSTKTASVPAISIHTTGVDKTWKEYTIDLSAFTAFKDFDLLRITFTGPWGATEYFVDDVVRVLQPFESEYTTPLLATVADKDVFYAIVKETNGCLARGSATFTVKECDPPAIDQAVTLCEEVRGTLKVSKQDLTKFDLTIRDSITTNTVTWYANKKLSTLVTTPTSTIVTKGDTLYALVKSPKGKQDTATLVYTIISLPNPKLPKDTAVCETGKAFTLTATPAGGTFKGIGVTAAGLYTPSATVIGKNIVTYTITDGNKCTDSNKVTVEVKPLPTAKIESTAADHVYCGTAGGKVAVTNITGATYSWTLDGKALTAGNSISAALKGTYAVTVDLNSCTQTISDITVVGNPVPTYTITGGGTFCNDTTVKPDITLTLTGTSPWSVKYTNGTISTTQSITTSPYIIPTPADGTYKVESISDKNCTGTLTTESVVYKTVQRPTSSIVTTDFEYCGSSSDVTLEVKAFSGASYVWKRGTDVVGGNSNTFASASAGTYSVTLTNDICKTTISGMTVVSNAKPTYSFSGGGSFCEGKKRTPVSIALTGKSPWDLAYDVAGTAKTVSVSASPYQIADTIAGTYSVKTLSDANGCVADVSTATDATASITVLTKPLVSIAPISAICASTKTIDVAASASPKTGGTGAYYGDAIDVTSGLFTHTGAKTYRVGYIFTSTNSCIDSAHTTITVNANPTAAISPRPASVCVSTNLTLNANPSSVAAIKTHDWSVNAAILSDKTIAAPIVNTNHAKDYALTYTLTDVNGCIGNDTITVRVNDTPSVAISVPTKVLCRDGGAITLTPVVAPIGGSGTFSPDSLVSGSSFDPKTHKIGTNIIRYDYTDKNGCSNYDTVHLFTKTPPSISVSGDSVACIYDAAYSLTASPASGTFTGSTAITAKGLFTPASIGDAAKKVTANVVYEYADANGCTNKIDYPITVYPRPSLTISGLADTVCYPQSAIKVVVVPANGTLSGSGIDAAALTFTPKTVGQNQSSTVVYDYTDSHGCSNSTSKNVFVRFTPAPTVPAIPYSIIKNDPVPAISATGKAIKWYDNDSSFLSALNPYTPSIDNTVEGKFVFKATQTISGCESNTASVRVEINNCPAKAPIPLSDTVCQGTAASYQISATKQGTGRLDWFDSKNTVIDNSGTTSLTVTETTPGTYSFLVKEFDLVNLCYSSETEVHLTIRALPTVSIIGDAKVCWPSTEIKYALSPVGGEFTGTGIADKATNIFNPSSTAKANATYTLTYKGFEKIGTLSCENTTTKDVSVTYSAVPSISTDNPSKLLLEEAVVTPPSFTASGADAIEWFDNAQASDVKYTSTSPSTFNTQLKAETGANGKSYWVRSISAGCPSELVEAKAIIIACPTPKPQVTNIADCENADSIRVLRAVGDLVKWYNAGGTLVGSGSVYKHGLSAAAATPYSFFATQTQTEPITGKACESPKQEAKLNIYFKPKPQFVALPTQACVDAAAITIGTSTDKKVVSEVFSIDSKVVAQQFLPADIHKGSHTIAYTVTDNEACSATISQTIQIDSTVAPTIAANDRNISEITVRPVPSLIASGSALKWYYSRKVSTATSIGSSSPYTDASIGEDDEVNRWYYVTQTLNGCQSLPDSIWLRINYCPVDTADVTISKPYVCEKETAPTFTARQGTHWTMDIKTDCVYKWYQNATGSSEISNAGSNEYTPTLDKVIGKRSYYVAEYNNYYNCRGPLREIVFTRVATAKPEVDKIDDICQGTDNPLMSVKSPIAGSTYTWYVDTTQTGTVGESFQSPRTDTTKIITFVAQTDKYGCRSKMYGVAFTIKPKPQAPTVANEWICFGENNKIITANGRANAIYQWFADNSNTVISSNQSYLPTVRTAQTYNYKVTQILNNCTSDAASVAYTIRALPEVPDVSDSTICPLRTSIPSFTPRNCTDSVEWFDSKKVLLYSQIPFTPSVKTTQTFIVQRTDNGCQSSKRFTMRVLDEINPPFIKVPNNSNTVCFATPLPQVSLTARVNYPKVVWYNDDTTAAIASQSTVYPINNMSAIRNYDYYVMQIDGNGCGSKFAKQTLTLKGQPDAPTITAFVSNCTNDNLFKPLSASANDGVISWYDSTGKVLGSGSLFTPLLIHLDVNDTVTFYTQTNNGCASQKSNIASVALYKNPAAPEFNNKAICYGDKEIQPLTAKAQGTIFWFVDVLDDSPDYVGDAFAFNPQAVRDYPIYAYSWWHGCQSATAQHSFTVAPIPTPKLVGKNRFCEHTSNADDARYKAIASQTNSVFDFKGTTQKYEFLDNTKSDIVVSWQTAGFDTVRVSETSTFGCVGHDYMPIQTASRPKVNFTSSIPAGQWQVIFNNTSTEDSIHGPNADSLVRFSKIEWNWGRSDNEPSVFESYQHYKADSSFKIPYKYGEYTIKLKISNTHGCADSAMQTIFYDIETNMSIPNVFAPENTNSEINIFRPKAWNLESYELTIYDQWGNILWASTKLINGQPAEGWDGKVNGQLVKSDTYIWRIDARFHDGRKWSGTSGKEEAQYGSFLLLR